MSSSTSSSDLKPRWSHLPDEKYGEELRQAEYAREVWLVGRLCWLSPLLFLISLPLFSCLLLPVLFLKPFNEDSLSWSRLFDDKTILLSAVVAAFPWIWKLSLLPKETLIKVRFPLAALLAVTGFIALNIGLEHPRVRWFFVEWAKLRTPNPSFARNTLFWEARDFEQLFPGGEEPTLTPKTMLLGSSQTYQSTDLEILSSEVPGVTWEKNCLAGLGPMQYPWLFERIAERKPDVIVCWLSEFDFYREDAVPTNRLRWAASPTNVVQLFQDLPNEQKWSSRGELADLFMAAFSSLWRQRDHIRRAAFAYWWDVSTPRNSAGPEVVLAESGDLKDASENLRQNVKRARLVDVNFRSFARFAQLARNSGITLIVTEGQTHPEAVKGYDPAYRIETRERLRELAATCAFDFYDESQVPVFTAAEFSDGYHLNARGRDIWSHFIGKLIRQHFEQQKTDAINSRGAVH